jgi:hypothetical protein
LNNVIPESAEDTEKERYAGIRREEIRKLNVEYNLIILLL